MNSVRSNYLSVNYERYTPSGCKYIGMSKFECVAKTKFLWQNIKLRILIFHLVDYNDRLSYYFNMAKIMFEMFKKHIRDISQISKFLTKSP